MRQTAPPGHPHPFLRRWFGSQLVRDDVTEVSSGGPVKMVTDGEGRTWPAHALILAMGSAYRQMGLPDERRLAGRGVHSRVSISLMRSASDIGTTVSASRKAPRASRVPTRPAYSGGQVGQVSRWRSTSTRSDAGSSSSR
jgi:hypothetical protein